MSRGISLHIGLNYVNPDAYDGWDGELAGCINDANDLERIASQQGYATTKITDSQATSGSVVQHINHAATQLNNGDYFLLTYSGHGGQVPDESAEEEDGNNETWVLWDRQLIDDELYALWSRFKAGVKIFILSDSCHSGTVIREFAGATSNSQPATYGNTRQAPLLNARQAMDEKSRFYRNMANDVFPGRRNVSPPQLRFIDPAVSLQNYTQNRSLYRSIRALAGSRDSNSINASIAFISGCQDNQYSYDGDDNGFFTGKVLKTWNNGQFNGGHRSFFEAILTEMPPYQTPNFLTIGATDTDFIESKPFTITAGHQGNNSSGGNSNNQGAGTVPRLEVANQWDADGAAPTFTAVTGEHPYYYIEVATDAYLFDYEQYGSQRTAENFYATWFDNRIAGRLTADQFTLPSYAWSNLREADRLYYRIGTTPQNDSWNGLVVSFRDHEYQNAPYFQLVEGGTQPGGQNNGTPGNNNYNCDLLGKAVGPAQPNVLFDVKMVQAMLNEVPRNEGGPRSKLTLDGAYGNRTAAAIERFQSEQNLATANGIIAPASTTVERLRSFFGQELRVATS